MKRQNILDYFKFSIVKLEKLKKENSVMLEANSHLFFNTHYFFCKRNVFKSDSNS